MAFDLNSIGSLISGGGLSAISRRARVNKEDVAKVLSAGIPALVGGMRRNAGAEEGAASLTQALADHSVDDTSNPGAFLKNSDLKDGKKILGHVLGSDQKALVDQIADASGVTKGKTTTILALVAPLLLSLLGSQNSSNNSSGGLLGLLGGLLGLGGNSQPAVQQPVVQQPVQQSSGGLLSGLFVGGQPAQQQGLGGGLLGSLLGGSSDSNASLASGLFSSLMGGGQSAAQPQQNTIQIGTQPQAQPQQEEQSGGGFLDGFLNLFR
ncbi:MAG: DUF937 domain-containing protein [Oscillospiraceae bacterium]|nr:DUF937 domain-containing protein [Oscillospiraceae bacterium]